MERSKLINEMLTKDALTENLMPTHSTSLDSCVDWFASIGSARNWTDTQITDSFEKALVVDPLVAMRILFWARDIREGAGERRVFRTCINYLDNNPQYKDYLYKNFHLIPIYGRWDDLFTLGDEKVLKLIKSGLEAEDGLLAKWLPRKGLFANKIRKYLNLTPKQYRKLIVKLSETVEQHMCAKKWENIIYEHVPSVAMHKYRKAFARNDEERYSNYIDSVIKGESTIKSGVLFPYQLYQAYKRNDNEKAVGAQWKNLPDYMVGNKFRMLPMCDTSGSMNSNYDAANSKLVPMDISVSLGIYISQRNVGPFKNAFLTFSHRPRLQYLSGSFYNRCRSLETANWDMNTNIEAVFELLLNMGKRANISCDEMPNMILILSDMQFDYCVQEPNDSVMEMIKRNYAQVGYEVPSIIFWNINARVGKMPIQFDEKNTGIVSGGSPTILKSILSGDILDPKMFMLKTVMSERYTQITI